MCLAVGIAAGAGHPDGDERAERLVAPDDRFDGLSADGTDGFLAVHAFRVGRFGAQRFLLYVRTTTPLPKVRTSSRAKGVAQKPLPNIGMPEP